MSQTPDQTQTEYLKEIILISDKALFPILSQSLLVAHPLATPKTLMLAKPLILITPIHDLETLKLRCQYDLTGARLVTCGTDVIVPDDILNMFDGPSYNIHPGLPDYPGRYPSVFAIYDGAQEFGTTVHELESKVDSGPIVAMDRFPMPEGATRGQLEILSFQSVLRLIGAIAPALMVPEPIPHVPADVASWHGVAKRQADFDALCKLPPDVSEDEFQRRWRAVGEGPNHALEITLFGHRFRLDNLRDGDVTIAGQPSK